MLSKSKIKLIRSLEHKKFRTETNLFLAEGDKLVSDLLPYFPRRLLAGTNEWLAANPAEAMERIPATPDQLAAASLMRTPQHVLALFEMREDLYTPKQLETQLCLALDGIQDPGNLGTIIRIADWFGITHVFCSAQCADIYSPKTIQATMGAIARVHVHTVDLPQWLSGLPGHTPVYGTFLNGSDLYTAPLSPAGIIVMGSEGRGISPQVAAHITHRLLIPSYPHGRTTSESLNVSTATAIVCAEFRRRMP